MSEVWTISLMPPTEQYRAYLYKAYICPDNNIVQNHFTIYVSLNKMSEKTSAVSTLTIYFIAISSFHMFNLHVTCQRTPTISDLFLFSPDVQPPGNYSLYNIVQKHFTIYLSLNKMSENSYNSCPFHFQLSDHRILQSTM